MSIEETIRIQQDLLAEVRSRTKIELSNIGNIKHLSKEQRQAIIPLFLQVLHRNIPASLRNSIYIALTGPGIKTASESVRALYLTEESSECFDALEGMLLYCFSSRQDELAETLCRRPRLLTDRGLRFLINKLSPNSDLAQEFKKLLSDCEIDTSALHVLSKHWPAFYDDMNRLYRSESKRFSAIDCVQLIESQVPQAEWFCKRVDVVPFYAELLSIIPFEVSQRKSVITDLCARNGISLSEGYEKLTNELISGKVSFSIVGSRTEAVSNDVIAIVCRCIDSSRLASFGREIKGRKPSGFVKSHRALTHCEHQLEALLLKLPVLPEWNLLPKKLLDPASSMRNVMKEQ